MLTTITKPSDTLFILIFPLKDGKLHQDNFAFLPINLRNQYEVGSSLFIDNLQDIPAKQRGIIVHHRENIEIQESDLENAKKVYGLFDYIIYNKDGKYTSFREHGYANELNRKVVQ